MLVNEHYEKHVEQLIKVAARFATALSDGGIDYRIVGGLAVYLHVNAIDPIAARLTRDIDTAVRRIDVEKISHILKPGLDYRHVAGVDMLVDARAPKARTAVHLVFVEEKVHPEYVEPVPKFSVAANIDGLLVAPVADLVRMKLTSFHLKDRVHIQDMDGWTSSPLKSKQVCPISCTSGSRKSARPIKTRSAQSRNSPATSHRAECSAVPCKSRRAPD